MTRFAGSGDAALLARMARWIAAFFLVAGGFCLVFLLVWGVAAWREAANRRLFLADGVAADATVVARLDRPVTRRQSELSLRLRFAGPGGGSVETEVRIEDLAYWQAHGRGARIPIRYLWAEPSRVLLTDAPSLLADFWLVPSISALVCAALAAVVSRLGKRAAKL